MSANDQETPNIAALHRTLIDKLITNQCLETEHVEAAFRAVPRHLFLPDVALERVYSDQAIPTKFENGRPISSSSQPAIMAIMLEQLDLQPGQRVLEIGAGTGFNAALMAHLVGEQGQVTTVDLDEDTAAAARQNLAAAGFERVNVICGDGMAGYTANAPYDRIILTVGGWDIAPDWLEQLKPDGRILLPLSINGPQLSVAFERRNNHLTSASIKPCGFMRLRGDLAEPSHELHLEGNSDWGLAAVSELAPVDPEMIYQWLTGPREDWSTNVKTTPRQLFRSLSLWLALHETRRCSLYARGESVDRGLIPPLFSSSGESKWQMTLAVLTETGIGALMRPPDMPFPPPVPPEGEPPPPFTLYVRGFGPDAGAARQLVDQVRAWDAAGRPGLKGLRIRALPLASQDGTGKVIKKKWHQFVMDYPDNLSEE